MALTDANRILLTVMLQMSRTIICDPAKFFRVRVVIFGGRLTLNRDESISVYIETSCK